MLGFASADLLMRHADKAWGSFVRGSQVRVEKLAARSYAVDFEGFAGASELVLSEMEGALEALSELTGVAELVVRRPRGHASSVRYLSEWK